MKFALNRKCSLTISSNDNISVMTIEKKVRKKILRAVKDSSGIRIKCLRKLIYSAFDSTEKDELKKIVKDSLRSLIDTNVLIKDGKIISFCGNETQDDKSSNVLSLKVETQENMDVELTAAENDEEKAAMKQAYSSFAEQQEQKKMSSTGMPAYLTVACKSMHLLYSLMPFCLPLHN